jgi:hypothetical protein
MRLQPAIVKVVFEFNRDGPLPSLFLYRAFTLPQPLATPTTTAHMRNVLNYYLLLYIQVFSDVQESV